LILGYKQSLLTNVLGFWQINLFIISSYYSLSAEKILQDSGFANISSVVFDYYDNDEGHKHWHKILETTAQKLV